MLVLATRFGAQITRLVSAEDKESLLLGVLGLTLLVAGIADQLKVSAAVGAFLVGIALSGTVAQIAVELLAPLRDVFAAVFFGTFGLSSSAGTLLPVLPLAILLTIVTAGTKITTGFGPLTAAYVLLTIVLAAAVQKVPDRLNSTAKPPRWRRPARRQPAPDPKG